MQADTLVALAHFHSCEHVARIIVKMLETGMSSVCCCLICVIPFSQKELAKTVRMLLQSILGTVKEITW